MSSRWWLGAILGAALAAGVAVVRLPIAAIAVAAILLAVSCGLLYASRLPSAFLGAFSVVLLGYAYLDKGFAYVGVPPVFIGELSLAAGLLCGSLAAATGGSGVLRSPVSWLIIAFATWGAIRTLPYVSIYGINAPRDAVIWGYGAFAIVVASLVLRSGDLWRLPTRYGTWLRLYPLWVPVAWLTYRLAGNVIPVFPGTDVQMLLIKSGDSAVHLGGVAAFALLGLHRPAGESAPRARKWTEWLWWIVWIAAAATIAAASRGGTLAMVGAIAVVVLLRPFSGWLRPAILTVAFAAVFAASGVSIDIGENRVISAEQVIKNVRSIGGNQEAAELQGTREWRLNWWRDIINYTVRGKYFWTGKGFGINLATDDGYQTHGDESARSPHNVYFMLLARSGVPGLLLWVSLQIVFLWTTARAYLRAQRAGVESYARLYLWILAYWTAFQLNASFDVYLEGPQGGIWFWSVVGLGIAAVEMQRRAAYSDGRAQRDMPPATALWSAPPGALVMPRASHPLGE